MDVLGTRSASRRPIRLLLAVTGVLLLAGVAHAPAPTGATGADGRLARLVTSDRSTAPRHPQDDPRGSGRRPGGFLTLSSTGPAGAVAPTSLLSAPVPVLDQPGDHPIAGVEEAAARLAPIVTPAVTSARFSYQNTDQLTGQPITWSPCRPIHYVVNTAGTPAGFTALVVQVANEISAATGLRLAYDGPSTEALSSQRRDYQPERYGERWAPVLVGYTSTATAGVPDSTAGLTSLVRVSSVAQPDAHYVTGQIAVFDTALSGMLSDGTPLVEQVLRHEFSHLVGLGHTPGLGQVMDSPNTGVARLQAGDLTGLSRLGQGTCAPGI